MKRLKLYTLFLLAFFLSYLAYNADVFAQGPADEQVEEDLPLDLLDEELPLDEEALPADEQAEEEINEQEEEFVENLEPAEEDAEASTRKVQIAGVIIMSYVFEDLNSSFIIRYRLQATGDLKAKNEAITGDMELEAEVENPMIKWPTGECNLTITIPKASFSLIFRESSNDKGSVKLSFTKPVMETWNSSCTFTDAPNASFDTSGPPERWLTRTLEKSRPPLRSIVVDLADEETTSSVIISKQIIGDPPIGSMEVEGSLTITISPE